MYRKKSEQSQLMIEDFILPFGGKLSAENRWVKLSKIMPWDLIEEIYAKNFKNEKADGRPPIPARIAFGALHIQADHHMTDEMTLESITENPYLQYFLGLREFQTESLFDISIMVNFRKRFSAEDIAKINEELYRRTHPPKNEPPHDKNIDTQNNDAQNSGGTQNSDIRDSSVLNSDTQNNVEQNSDTKNSCGTQNNETKNSGTLVLDATAAPADVRYPTDLSLLNECRENLEELIDEIWDYSNKIGHKTSYNRKKARASYLKVAKQRKPKKKAVKQAIEEQLYCVERGLADIDKLLTEIPPDTLTTRQKDRLEVIRKVAVQQREHADDAKKSIPDRIVNLRQPHVRPIVRGKAGCPVEFGQKLAFSVVNGFTFIDKQSWNNFNEGITLIDSAQKYKARFGHLPEAILADSIYRNRENRQFCKEHGIRLSGPRLGRPKLEEIEADKAQAYQDSCDRNIVESRNGISKRRYGLNRIFAYLDCTAKTEAALIVFAMNAALCLRTLLRLLFWQRFYHKLRAYRCPHGAVSKS